MQTAAAGKTEAAARATTTRTTVQLRPGLGDGVTRRPTSQFPAAGRQKQLAGRQPPKLPGLEISVKPAAAAAAPVISLKTATTRRESLRDFKVRAAAHSNSP